MPVTFHTPPSWPAAPAGFVPPAGWRPDPSWAPAPAGWVFYTDNGMPVPPPPGAWQPAAQAPSPGGQSPAQPGFQASPAVAPTTTPPGSFGPSAAPAAAFGQPGGTFPPEAWGQPVPPPAKKKRVGLFIGIGAGALVLVIAVVVIAVVLFVNNAAPTLTAAQFDTVFSKGSTVLGRTISERSTGTPSRTSTTDACQIALNDIVVEGEDWFYATTSDNNLLISGARYGTASEAEAPYKVADAACTKTGTGSVNGAKWFSIEVENTSAVIVHYGNVGILAATPSSASMTMSDLAGAVQKEVADAAKR